MRTLTSRTTLTITGVLLLAASCGHDVSHGHGHGHDSSGASTSHAAPAEMPPAPSENASVHALRCGCAIESVGACGEYIEVDGQFVELELPVDMGPMPFCGRDGLQAKVDGALAAGAFVATTFAYVD